MSQKRNLELPREVDELLDAEKQNGTSITRTVSAAVYWYFNRLESAQRELARKECQEWIEAGTLPSSAVASEIEEALRGVRERELRRSRRRSGGAA